ncbi:MAG: beta-galactosidase trimerization domain-containing protein [Acidobacteria bacterium]|nr:beta-galactosidase trimerization domain-containing protein [Acidobacteriota bacterium]
MLTRLALLLLIAASLLPAQPAQWFPPEQLMTIGVYYYPEAWPESQWGAWGDILEPRPGTEVLATYADQFYQGSAAATRHKLGKGHVIYIGVDSLTGELEADLLAKIYADNGAKPARLPLNFMLDWRDGFWTATNFTDTPQPLPVPPGAKLLTGTNPLPPGAAAIWQ